MSISGDHPGAIAVLTHARHEEGKYPTTVPNDVTRVGLRFETVVLSNKALEARRFRFNF
jgi:hypothetical protein